MDVDQALAYFERLDRGDVSDVCAPSSEDEFVASDSSVSGASGTQEGSAERPEDAENFPNADDDDFCQTRIRNCLLSTMNPMAMNSIIPLSVE